MLFVPFNFLIKLYVIKYEDFPGNDVSSNIKLMDWSGSLSLIPCPEPKNGCSAYTTVVPTACKVLTQWKAQQ